VVLSALRDAAALFVEAGKALGHLEHSRASEKVLGTLLSEAESEVNGPDGAIYAFAQHRQRLLIELRTAEAKRRTLEGLAKAHRDRAAELVEELEKPGTVLARRFVAVALAARAAWRGSR
jgi:hypothetical protein